MFLALFNTFAVLWVFGGIVALLDQSLKTAHLANLQTILSALRQGCPKLSIILL